MDRRNIHSNILRFSPFSQDLITHSEITGYYVLMYDGKNHKKHGEYHHKSQDCNYWPTSINYLALVFLVQIWIIFICGRIGQNEGFPLPTIIMTYYSIIKDN